MDRRVRPSVGGLESDVLSSPLLAGLPTEVIEDFLERARLVTLPPRQSVFSAGDPVRVHLLISGRVKIVRRGEHGRENILVLAGAGELMGSLNLFEDLTQPTDAVTLGPATIFELTTASMRGWLEAHSSAAMSFVRLLVDRLQRQNDAMNDIFGLDVGTRVARAITREAGRFGRHTDEGIRVNLGLSQEELALHVRASRESVNHALSNLVKQGCIRREGTEFLVLDEDQLNRRALRAE